MVENEGFETRSGEWGSLDLLKSNLQHGRPTLVLWTDWDGHWAAVVGYDDHGTVNTTDDDIVLADPYDRADGQRDGLTIFNAERFDAMWSDALHFGRLRSRVYLYLDGMSPSAGGRPAASCAVNLQELG